MRDNSFVQIPDETNAEPVCRTAQCCTWAALLPVPPILFRPAPWWTLPSTRSAGLCSPGYASIAPIQCPPLLIRIRIICIRIIFVRNLFEFSARCSKSLPPVRLTIQPFGCPERHATPRRSTARDTCWMCAWSASGAAHAFEPNAAIQLNIEHSTLHNSNARKHPLALGQGSSRTCSSAVGWHTCGAVFRVISTHT